MIVCTVAMYGITHDITDLREVQVELEDGAGLRDVVAALRHKIPRLEGRVIAMGEDRLMGHCAFNIDGRFCFDDAGVRFQDGDHIGLLTLASGG
jgi:hypothetical protein